MQLIPAVAVQHALSLKVCSRNWIQALQQDHLLAMLPEKPRLKGLPCASYACPAGVQRLLRSSQSLLLVCRVPVLAANSSPEPH